MIWRNASKLGPWSNLVADTVCVSALLVTAKKIPLEPRALIFIYIYIYYIVGIFPIQQFVIKTCVCWQFDEICIWASLNTLLSPLYHTFTMAKCKKRWNSGMHCMSPYVRMNGSVLICLMLWNKPICFAYWWVALVSVELHYMFPWIKKPTAWLFYMLHGTVA